MILQTIYRKLLSTRSYYLERIVNKGEMRNIEKKKKLWSNVKLTADEEKEIQDYWERISGLKIDTRWHRLYQSYMGAYNKEYFPEILFSTKLERILCPPKYYGILSDKGFLTSVFPGSEQYRTPITYCWNCDGVYIDSRKMIVYRQKIVEDLWNKGKVVIKPTRDTSSGEGVQILNILSGIDKKTGRTIETILDEYKSNYIIQECIEQCDTLSNLYAKSLNTFRIITFITPDGIQCAPIGMRMGRSGSEVDNIHAGGLMIGVSDGYSLRKYAFSEMGNKYERHPDSGVCFENYLITALESIVSVAMHLHSHIPQLKMISWDWSIDNNNIPVLIEINITGQAVWFPQILNGQSVFGEYT